MSFEITLFFDSPCRYLISRLKPGRDIVCCGGIFICLEVSVNITRMSPAAAGWLENKTMPWNLGTLINCSKLVLLLRYTGLRQID